jgi:signal transduction histidine kinase
MAHDLRAPLALARQAIEAVERPIRSGEPVDLSLITDVDARLRRSLRTIQLVLDSARGELAAPARAEPTLINVSAEVRDEVASFAEEARSRGKELRAVPPGADVLARLDAAVLRQSLAILLDNAIRYSVPGLIQITVTSAAGQVVIGVRDEGPGLTRRQNPTGGSGEGLGLQLCALLARRSGGTLSVARDAEDGTEFVLRLPASGRRTLEAGRP